MNWIIISLYLYFPPLLLTPLQWCLKHHFTLFLLLNLCIVWFPSREGDIYVRFTAEANATDDMMGEFKNDSWGHVRLTTNTKVSSCRYAAQYSDQYKQQEYWCCTNFIGWFLGHFILCIFFIFLCVVMQACRIKNNKDVLLVVEVVTMEMGCGGWRFCRMKHVTW